MREQLRELNAKDHGCVITARKIQHLGFSAPTMLKDYFQTFGTVESVLVPRSHVRSCFLVSGLKRRQATVRERPAHLGFVIMENAASVEAVLAAGSEHTIGDATIVLELFDAARWNAGGGGGGGQQV